MSSSRVKALLWLLPLLILTAGFDPPDDAVCRIVDDFPLPADIAIMSGSEVKHYRTGDSTHEPHYGGSLFKPFIAVRLLKTGEISPGQIYECRMALEGQEGLKRCWLERGHGSLDLPHAIAYSCNRWFAQALQDVDLADLDNWMRWAREVNDPPIGSPGMVERLVGIDPVYHTSCEWGVQVFAMLIETEKLAKEEIKKPVLEGLRLAVAEGTASRLSREFPALLLAEPYGKTGSAPGCDDRPEGGWLYLSFLDKEKVRIHLVIHVDNGDGADAVDLATKLLPRWFPGREK